VPYGSTGGAISGGSSAPDARPTGAQGGASAEPPRAWAARVRPSSERAAGGDGGGVEGLCGREGVAGCGMAWRARAAAARTGRPRGAAGDDGSPFMTLCVAHGVPDWVTIAGIGVLSRRASPRGGAYRRPAGQGGLRRRRLEQHDCRARARARVGRQGRRGARTGRRGGATSWRLSPVSGAPGRSCRLRPEKRAPARDRHGSSRNSVREQGRRVAARG